MDPLTVSLLTVAAVVVVLLLLLVLLCGSDFRRPGLAFQVLRDRALADRVQELLVPPPPPPPPKPSGAPLRLVALLQREGRLVDFLLEDIQAYPDAQIGAAVRDIHRQCQAALKEHLDLAPVLPQAEGEAVEVPPGFDPSAVRVTGNVTGEPPFRGVLRHHGWRVTELKLASPPEGQDEFVLQPAEVDLP